MNCNCRGGPSCCRNTANLDATWQFTHSEDARDEETIQVPPPPMMPQEGIVPLVARGLSPDMDEDR